MTLQKEQQYKKLMRNLKEQETLLHTIWEEVAEVVLDIQPERIQEIRNRTKNDLGLIFVDSLFQIIYLKNRT